MVQLIAFSARLERNRRRRASSSFTIGRDRRPHPARASAAATRVFFRRRVRGLPPSSARWSAAFFRSITLSWRWIFLHQFGRPAFWRWRSSPPLLPARPRRGGRHSVDYNRRESLLTAALSAAIPVHRARRHDVALGLANHAGSRRGGGCRNAWLHRRRAALRASRSWPMSLFAQP